MFNLGLKTANMDYSLYVYEKNGRWNLCIDEKISVINFKYHGLLLNERNELVFKCRHKSKFRLSWLGANEAPTLDKYWSWIIFIGINNI